MTRTESYLVCSAASAEKCSGQGDPPTGLIQPGRSGKAETRRMSTRGPSKGVKSILGSSSMCKGPEQLVVCEWGESDRAGLRGPGFPLTGFKGFPQDWTNHLSLSFQEEKPTAFDQSPSESKRLRSTELVRTSHSETRKLRSERNRHVPRLSRAAREPRRRLPAWCFPRLHSRLISGRGVPPTAKGHPLWTPILHPGQGCSEPVRAGLEETLYRNEPQSRPVHPSRGPI